MRSQLVLGSRHGNMQQPKLFLDVFSLIQGDAPVSDIQDADIAPLSAFSRVYCR